MHLRLRTIRVVSETSTSAAASRGRRILRHAVLLLAVGIGLSAIAPPAFAQSYTLTPNSANFTVGSTGYSGSGNIPSTASNLLSAATLSFGAGTPSVPTNGGGSPSTATSWSVLTDGVYGTVPPSGGGGLGEAYVTNGYSLTYTFASGYNLNTIDVFSGWGDAGRFQQNYTIFYSLESAPSTFIQLGNPVNYAPLGTLNGAWTQLTLTGVSNVAAVKFSFGTQENNGVGYTELAVLGNSVNAPLNWTGGGGSSGNGSWDTTASTANWTNTTTSSPANYANGNLATFNDSGANTNISIQSGGVAPTLVTFSNASVAYSFTDADAVNGITGSTGVTLNGSGSVTFKSPNSYTGATTINSGTLTLNNNLAVQNSTVTLNGGSLRFGSGITTPAIGGLAGSGNLALTTTASEPVALTVGSNNQSTIYIGALSGGNGLTKVGSGTLLLAATQTYSGPTTVSGTGTLRIGPGTPVIGTASYATSGPYSFTPAANNLLRGLSPTANTNTLAGQAGNNAVPTGAVTTLTDGAISNTGVEATDLPNLYTIGSGAMLTYSLGGGAFGYNLSQINIYSEWNDNGRSTITLNDISYSTVLSPTVFSPIANMP